MKFFCSIAISVVTVSFVSSAHAVDLARPLDSQVATRRPAFGASSRVGELAGVETSLLVSVNGRSTAASLNGTLKDAFPSAPEVQPNWVQSLTSSLTGGAPAGPSHNCGTGGASGSVSIDGRRFYYRIGSDGVVELRDNVRVGGPFWRVRAPVANVSLADFIERLPSANGLRFRALQNTGVDRLASFLPAGARAAFEASLAEALAPPRRRSVELPQPSAEVREGVEALRAHCRGSHDLNCETSERRVALVPFLVQTLGSVQTTVPVRSLVIERCRASDGQCAPDSPSAIVPDREASGLPHNATDGELNRLSRRIELYRSAFSRSRGIRGEPLDVVLSASGRWELVGLDQAADPNDVGLEGFRANLASLRERLVKARSDQAAYRRRADTYTAENREISDVRIMTTSFRLLALNNCCRDTACRQEILATGGVRDAGGAPADTGVQEPRGPRTEI